MAHETALSIIPDPVPHYYGKGDIEQIEIFFCYDKDQQAWYAFLKELITGKRVSKNDRSSSSSSDDEKFSPRNDDDHTPRRRRSTSSRKKDSKSSPNSPTVQASVRSSNTAHTATKKRTHSTTANSSVVHSAPAAKPVLTQSLPDLPLNSHAPAHSPRMRFIKFEVTF
jgi:hypothetical protein